MDRSDDHGDVARGPVVLIAAEPRLFRDVIGNALAKLRPDFRVVVAEREHLGHELTRHRPLVVILTDLPEAIETRIPIWFLLNLDESHRHVISTYGRRIATNHLDLDAIISIIADHAWRPAAPPLRRLNRVTGPSRPIE